MVYKQIITYSFKFSRKSRAKRNLLINHKKVIKILKILYVVVNLSNEKKLVVFVKLTP